MKDTIQLALESLLQRGAVLPPNAEAALRSGIEKFSGVLTERTVEETIDGLIDGFADIANPQQVVRPGETLPVTVGQTEAGLVGKISKLLLPYENADLLSAALNLRFKVGTALDVMQGGARFLTDQTDLDVYPAWQFQRRYDREVPRGLKKSGKAIVPDADKDWASRWAAAGAAIEDNDWRPWVGDRFTGYGIALKSSGIWQALGNGEGGYTDTLGNPFPPFAFNSGFDVDGVPRKECIALGLLEADEPAKPSRYDFNQLISLPEAA